MKDYTQAEISEILFHFHLDQAASHMQAMTVTLPMTETVVKDFNFLKTILNRIWRTQDKNLKSEKAFFEDEASKMDEFLQIFIQVTDQKTVINYMQKLLTQEKTKGETIVINRDVVEEQKRHLHSKINL